MRGEEIEPGNGVQTDEEILDFIAREGESAYHPSCTCKMGNDEMAVVDEDLKVHGIDNLRVVDASIMPSITNGNLYAPTMMIAEKSANIILENPPYRHLGYFSTSMILGRNNQLSLVWKVIHDRNIYTTSLKLFTDA